MTNPKPTIALIGGGKMGRALVQGMLKAGFTDADSVHVGEPFAESRQWWKENVPEAHVSEDNKVAVESSSMVLVAVKPDTVSGVLSELKKLTRKSLVVSIAAGITLDTLVKSAGSARVVRVMPNTPCLVSEGACAYCCGEDVSAEDKETVERMLSSVGIAVEVQDKLMDAVTGLSGSGPAFVCLMIEALADGGVLSGLPRDLAMKLATQTVLGTATLVKETGMHPGQLKDAVASPGGTTITGLAELESKGLRQALISAVKAATDRGKELG